MDLIFFASFLVDLLSLSSYGGWIVFGRVSLVLESLNCMNVDVLRCFERNVDVRNVLEYSGWRWCSNKLDCSVLYSC